VGGEAGREEESPPLRICGYSMANPLRSLAGQRNFKFARLMFVEVSQKLKTKPSVRCCLLEVGNDVLFDDTNGCKA